MKKISNQTAVYSIPDHHSGTISLSSKQHWLIFISEQEHDRIENLELLKKIIEALKLSWENDIAIIKFNPDSTEYFNQLVDSPIKYIVCFGLLPNQLSLQGFEQKYHLYHIYDKTLLFADFLITYTNYDTKKILWQVLQEMKENK